MSYRISLQRTVSVLGLAALVASLSACGGGDAGTTLTDTLSGSSGGSSSGSSSNNVTFGAVRTSSASLSSSTSSVDISVPISGAGAYTMGATTYTYFSLHAVPAGSTAATSSSNQVGGGICGSAFDCTTATTFHCNYAAGVLSCSAYSGKSLSTGSYNLIGKACTTSVSYTTSLKIDDTCVETTPVTLSVQ